MDLGKCKVRCLCGLQSLAEVSGVGLMDRLITADYHQRGITVLTNDKGMSKAEQFDFALAGDAQYLGLVQ